MRGSRTGGRRRFEHHDPCRDRCRRRRDPAARAVFCFAAQRSEEQRERSREEFGPEYERTVQKRGSEEDAERELRERRGRVERQIGPLSEQSLAVMHPDVADDYREARRVRAEVVARTAGRSDEDQGEESTEDLRQAIRRYRTVYELLVRQ
jgi:hypothetical protein